MHTITTYLNKIDELIHRFLTLTNNRNRHAKRESGMMMKDELYDEVSKFWNNDGYLRNRGLAHWLGTACFEDEDKWHSIGEKHLMMFEQLSVRINSMVEWGGGGGANAIHFSPLVDVFYNVDISKSSLNECGLQLQEMNAKYKPILIRIEEPRSVLKKIDTVDFFLSTYVYQHMPGREYATEVTRIAHELLKPGGMAIIQTVYGGKDISRNGYDIDQNFVAFTRFSIDEFWSLCERIGLTPLYVHIEPDSNHAYYFLRKLDRIT